MIKLLAAVAFASALVFGVTFVRRLNDKQSGSIDCDRRRGSCVVLRGAAPLTLDIRELTSAIVKVAPFTRQRDHYVIEVLRRDSTAVYITGEAYSMSTRNGFEAVAKGLNDFLQDPSKPGFKADYIAGDANLYFPAFMAFFSLVLGAFFLRAIFS